MSPGAPTHRASGWRVGCVQNWCIDEPLRDRERDLLVGPAGVAEAFSGGRQDSCPAVAIADHTSAFRGRAGARIAAQVRSIASMRRRSSPDTRIEFRLKNTARRVVCHFFPGGIGHPG